MIRQWYLHMCSAKYGLDEHIIQLQKQNICCRKFWYGLIRHKKTMAIGSEIYPRSNPGWRKSPNPPPSLYSHTAFNRRMSGQINLYKARSTVRLSHIFCSYILAKLFSGYCVAIVCSKTSVKGKNGNKWQWETSEVIHCLLQQSTRKPLLPNHPTQFSLFVHLLWMYPSSKFPNIIHSLPP